MFLLVVLPACWALQTLTSQSPRLRPLRGSYVDLGELVRNKLIEVEATGPEQRLCILRPQCVRGSCLNLIR